MPSTAQLSRIQAIRKYERIFDDMESRLRGAVAVLRQTCEELLQGLGIPDDQLRDLIENQQGWDSESLKTKLKSQMGTEDYGDFEAVAASLRRRLDDLGAQLSLDRRWQVSNSP